MLSVQSELHSNMKPIGRRVAGKSALFESVNDQNLTLSYSSEKYPPRTSNRKDRHITCLERIVPKYLNRKSAFATKLKSKIRL